MAVTKPTTFVAPSLLQFSTGEDIDGEDYLACAHAEQMLYSKTGARVCGLILNPIFTTTSATYTQTTTGAGRELNGWTGIINARRGDEISLTIFGANCDVKLSLNPDAEPGAGSTQPIVASVVGSTFAAATASATLTTTGPHLVFVEVKYNAAGTARLAQFDVHEQINP